MIKTLTFAAALVLAVSTAAEARSHHGHRYHRIALDANANETFLPHPAGCPARLFCGCGARKHLGIDDPRLNLAANWPRLYHGSTPVAVWDGHVAVIDRMTGPNSAMLYDYNSGGHLSRYHERSLAGARIIGAFGRSAALGATTPTYY